MYNLFPAIEAELLVSSYETGSDRTLRNPKYLARRLRELLIFFVVLICIYCDRLRLGVSCEFNVFCSSV
jgi:hypothetical protein